MSFTVSNLPEENGGGEMIQWDNSTVLQTVVKASRLDKEAKKTISDPNFLKHHSDI